ncbi:MAG: ABC transporter ATP-binding protein/permease [Propionibacteriaceae bacterium]|jgi:ABC-type multidrug transport system fused ATPase/permease subunit|nr:ABC transporter ATP-binding protein/permease [Propionibacteriaceae bacterium]
MPDRAATVQTRPSLPRRLLGLARPFWRPLLFSTVFRLVGLVLGIALLGIGGWAVGSLAVGTLISIKPVVRTMVVLALVKGLMRYLEQYCGHWAAFRALAEMRLDFYDHLAPQAPAAITGSATGDLLNRMTRDIDRVEVFFAHTLAPAITAVIVPVATVAWFGVTISWPGAAVLAVFLLVTGILVPSLGNKACQRAAREVRAARGQAAAHITDTVQGVAEILGFSFSARRLAELDELGAPIESSSIALGRWIARRRGMSAALVAGAVLTELAILAAAGLDMPHVLMGVGVTAGAFTPVRAVEDFTADLQQAFASAARIFEVADAPSLTPDAPDAETTAASIPEGVPRLELNRVSFVYPGQGSVAALTDITAVVEPGDFVGIVGASGSGKSTLAALLTRSWDVTQGAITLDGHDIRTLPVAWLRDQVTFAAQRPFLFTASIRDNVTLDDPAISQDVLNEAAQTAHLTPVLSAREEGWDAPSGERGDMLSGGEQQRLALTRAFVRPASIVILDEVTSQLDPATEEIVLRQLREATRGKTVLMIAHKIATLKDADRILVLDAGRLVQQGTYADLASRPGPFAALLARETE